MADSGRWMVCIWMAVGPARIILVSTPPESISSPLYVKVSLLHSILKYLISTSPRRHVATLYFIPHLTPPHRTPTPHSTLPIHTLRLVLSPHPIAPHVKGGRQPDRQFHGRQHLDPIQSYGAWGSIHHVGIRHLGIHHGEGAQGVAAGEEWGRLRMDNREATARPES